MGQFFFIYNESTSRWYGYNMNTLPLLLSMIFLFIFYFSFSKCFFLAQNRVVRSGISVNEGELFGSQVYNLVIESQVMRLQNARL